MDSPAPTLTDSVTLTITRQQAKLIAELGQRMETQDNRATRDPVWLVQRAILDYGIDGEYTDEEAWIDDGELVPRSYWEKLTEADTQGKSEIDIDGTTYVIGSLTKTGTRLRWETVTACFTEIGAKEYLDRNGHNLNGVEEPRIFVDSLFRNQEMIDISGLLVELGKTCRVLV
jgi:hypothetical protein